MKPFQCSSTVGRVAVDLEPCQRVLERAAVHQRALGARRHLEVREPALQRSSCRNRSVSPRAIGSMPILRIGSFGGPPRPPAAPPAAPAVRTFGTSSSSVVVVAIVVDAACARASASTRAASAACRAGSGCVSVAGADSNRGGRRRAPPSASHSASFFAPRCISGVTGSSRRCSASAAERLLRGARAQDLVVLLDQARRRGRAPWRCRCVAIAPDHRRVEREVEARRHHDRAQHAHRIFLEALVRIADAADQPSFRSSRPPT